MSIVFFALQECLIIWHWKWESRHWGSTQIWPRHQRSLGLSPLGFDHKSWSKNGILDLVRMEQHPSDQQRRSKKSHSRQDKKQVSRTCWSRFQTSSGNMLAFNQLISLIVLISNWPIPQQITDHGFWKNPYSNNHLSSSKRMSRNEGKNWIFSLHPRPRLLELESPIHII